MKQGLLYRATSTLSVVFLELFTVHEKHVLFTVHEKYI